MNDNIVSRLRALGQRPVDPALASAHLTAMGAAGVRQPWFRQKLQVAAALVAGLLVGSTGLAAAGALPDTAQQAAHTALGKVGVNVPPGHDRVTEGCGTDEDGEPFRNHGQYVKAHEGDPEAAASDCGKPRKSVKGDEAADAACPEGQRASKAKGEANGAGKANANVAKGCKPGGPARDGAKADDDEAPAGATSGDPAGEDAEDDGDDPASGSTTTTPTTTPPTTVAPAAADDATASDSSTADDTPAAQP